jgi:hypothetical protein
VLLCSLIEHLTPLCCNTSCNNHLPAAIIAAATSAAATTAAATAAIAAAATAAESRTSLDQARQHLKQLPSCFAAEAFLQSCLQQHPSFTVTIEGAS